MENIKVKKGKFQNKWKLATVCLVILCIVIVTSQQFWKPVNGNWKTSACEKATKELGTPAWFDNQGDVLAVGYILLSNISNMSKQKLIEAFITQKVYFAYKETCGWCEKQIEEFKKYNFWEDYQKEGLTIKCK
jgi:hypothetical protein